MKNNNYRIVLSKTFIFYLSTIYPDAVRAQDTSNSVKTLGAADIVVTARRREERLQDVPVAITALSQESLRESGVVHLTDLQRAVPALQILGSGNGKNIPTYTIRSQRNSQISVSVDPSVAVYFAEVVQVRSHGINSGMFDIDSVQVLKGPQGTLFGRNSTGGAIVITPKKPTDNIEGYGQLTLGNYGQHNFEGAVNLPVSDALQFRFGGQIQRNDGYTFNAFNGTRLDNDHNESWRASMHFKPVAWIENNLVIWGFHANEAGTGSRARFLGPPATTLYPGTIASFAKTQASDFHTVYDDAPLGFPARTFGLSNITELKLNSDLSIKNILGYRYVRATSKIDLDGLDQPVFSGEVFTLSKQWTDELQLLGKAFGGTLDYILGGYYYRETASERERNYQLGLFRGNADDVVNGSKSVFAQATLKIPGIERISVTGGLRQTWDERQILQLNRQSTTIGGPIVCALTNLAGALLNPCQRLQKADFDKLTYTFAVDYKINRDNLVYFTHRKGYRAGGFNYRASAEALAVPFRPEVVKDYEIGLKSSFNLGNDIRGRFNIAAYYQDYRDIQRTRGIVSATGKYLGAGVENAANAHVKGIEPELTLQFNRALTLSGYYAYSKGRYINYVSRQANGSLADLTHSPFSGAPTHSGGATATWRLPVRETLGEVRLIGNVYAQTKTYGTDSTYSPTLGVLRSVEMPGYVVVNGRIEWNGIAQSNWSLAVYCRNLLDKNYYTSTTDVLTTGIGVSQSQLGDPRTYGLELSYHW